MVSTQPLRRIFLLFLVALTVSLWSCGGGGGSSSGLELPGTGDVALLVTDAPSDEYAEILVTIQRVEFLSETKRVETFRGERTIDLLRLRSESILFSLASRVPVGDYHKIRLHVSRVLVVKKDSSGNAGEAVEAKLPANGKIDLNPRGVIRVGAGATIIVQLDLDANNSIHIVHAGKSDKILFRPVVFVKVLTFELDGKLVRLEGFVEDLDREGGTFRLCPDGTAFVHAATNGIVDDDDDDGPEDIDPTTSATTSTSISVSSSRRSSEGTPRCVTIALSEATSIFAPDAVLLPLEQLAGGDKVTVIGHLRFDREGEFTRPDSDHSGLILDAALVEIWEQKDVPPYDQVKGTVLSEVSSDPDCPEVELCDPVFKFELDGGPTALVQLVKGAKVFDRDGLERTPDDIREGLGAVLDAVFFRTETGSDRLRAPLIVLDTLDGPSLQKLEGTIVSIAADGSSMTLLTDGDDPREICVEITEETQVILLTLGQGGFDSERIGVEDLAPNMEIDVFAESSGRDDDCVVAKDILTMAVTDALAAE